MIRTKKLKQFPSIRLGAEMMSPMRESAEYRILLPRT